MRAAAGRAAHRVGRRGAVLSLKGLMVLLYGYALLISPLPDTRGLRLLLGLMPLHCWATMWMLAGSTALVCAWARQGADWLGFTVLWLVIAPWALSYLVSWWLYGYSRGWIGGLIWCAFGSVALVCAAWPEPARDAEEGGAGER